MSKESAIENNRGNMTAECLAFCDFRTCICYGWDSARPKDEGYMAYVWFLILKFMVMTRPVVRYPCEIDQEF